MIVYTLLTVTILLALSSLSLLWMGGKSTMSEDWPLLLPGFCLGICVYLYGAWVFVSVYGKYVFLACFVLSLFNIVVRKKIVREKTSGRAKKEISLFFSFIFLVLSILYFTGTTGRPYGIAHLALPFKSGTYFVFQGGKGLPTNLFHYSLRTAVFAMDIVKLNGGGGRAKHIFSKKLEDYEIFNDTVYSPCSGRVIRERHENIDNIPPSRKRGPSNTNQVVLETDSMYVFLAHFKQNNVFVREGDRVRTGQPLGLAGNSGFSIEPHLHIQAHSKANGHIPWYKEKPLLMEFDGKSYLLFEEIKAGRK